MSLSGASKLLFAPTCALSRLGATLCLERNPFLAAWLPPPRVARHCVRPVLTLRATSTVLCQSAASSFPSYALKVLGRGHFAGWRRHRALVERHSRCQRSIVLPFLFDWLLLVAGLFGSSMARCREVGISRGQHHDCLWAARPGQCLEGASEIHKVFYFIIL